MRGRAVALHPAVCSWTGGVAVHHRLERHAQGGSTVLWGMPEFFRTSTLGDKLVFSKGRKLPRPLPRPPAYPLLSRSSRNLLESK